MSGTKLPTLFAIGKDFKLTYNRPLGIPIKKTATTVDQTTFVAVFQFLKKISHFSIVSNFFDNQYCYYCFVH